MKIIGVDNFDRDYISHILIAENMNETWAKRIANLLNDAYCNYPTSETFYRAVEDDYALFVWEP